MRAKQGQQGRFNKGFANSVKYWAGLACGKDFDSLVEVFQVFQDPNSLKEMGFLLSFDELGCRHRMPQHIRDYELQGEAEWLQLAWCVAFAVVDHRATNLLQSWCAFPGRCAQLLSEDQVEAGLKWCCDVAEVWLAAVKRKEPHVLELLKRSFMNTAAAHHVFNRLSFWEHTKVTVEVKQCLEAVFGIGQSRVQEINFHGHRRSETRCQKKKGLAPIKRWLNPVWLKLASKTFKYKEVDFRSVARNVKLEPGAEMYQQGSSSHVKRPPLWISDLSPQTNNQSVGQPFVQAH